ncbi:MAG TPA: hypothetical protein VE377_04775 [Candidatus Dormibacteraeota bacterium]|nr:hypothetical protein [Candidatus Dormibacteraeota bacterium]
MSLRNRLVLPAILSALTVLAGCGGGGVSNPTPPPSGGFTNSNFNGTYTFSIAGADILSNQTMSPFAMAGSLVACGCTQGTISSGTVDLSDTTGVSAAATIGGNSTYRITTDGRGFAKLFITPVGGSAFEVDVDFVLTSSSHGLIIRYDNSGTGSGTIDLQPAAVAQSSLDVTPYAFSLSGSDNANHSLSTAGALTINSSGAITTGVADFNFANLATSQLALSGSVTVGTGTAPGSATLTTGDANFPVLTFDVYAIDSTHLKLIESDGQAVLVGDLFSQPSTSFPAGNLVFTMSGLDLNGDLFVTGGVMASDGTSVISSGSEDVNDAGTVDNGTTTPFGFTGNFSSSGGGRFQLDLTNYVGGSTFAAYPSSGGLLMLEIDNGGVAGGFAAVQQAGATVAASQGYGLNIQGEDLSQVFSGFPGFEFDDVAEFKTTSTGMTGLVDANDNGLFTDNMSGTYTNGSGGFGSATFTKGGFGSMFFYAVDSSTALFISTDPTQAALGSFEVQSTPVNEAHLATAKPHAMPMLRVLPRTRSGSKKNQSILKKAK